MKPNRLHKSLALLVMAGLCGLISAATSFTPSAQPVGFIAQLEVTNFKLTSGSEVVFKTDYERTNWSGNVFAYPVTAKGEVIASADWWNDGAAVHLDAQDYDTGRLIVTMKDDGTKQPFRWVNLSAAQQALLGTATTGPQILNFVRGQRTNEKARGGTLRDRVSTLGDILHSRPYYMSNGGSPVLFVGANDGMLHAFNAKTAGGGGELWAYVPSMVFSNLPALAQNPYAHTYFVDGGLNVGDAVIAGVSKKVLVSGLGAGGRGLFAIDVTNPVPTTESAAAANILWEVSNAKASYGNLGYTYGTPVIAPVNSASGQAAVLMGNGYNAAGASSLFVISTADGSLIREIDTGGAAGGGLSTPTCIDANGDRRVDICYAGDIDGKLWKFDLTSSTPSQWTSSLLHTTSPAQAITMAPAIAAHPYGGYMVNFATGRVLTNADAADTSVHYAYGIWDGAPASNTALLSQTLTERVYVSGSTSKRVRVVTANQPVWTATSASCSTAACVNHRGWRVPLPVAGERSTGDTVFIENYRFYFSTTNPTIVNSSPTPNGENWLMELDFLNGSTVNSPFFDLTGDLVLNDNDRVKYVSSDALPPGKAVGDPYDGAGGVPVGKFISNGVGSHPLLVSLATLNTTLMNQNPDVTFPPSAPATDRGVSGGHFDVDIYYPTYGGASKHHVHEYDDKYNVTGVNMLNASDPLFNLSNGISSTSTKFKVLVQNQYLSPAVALSVGGAALTSVKLYNDLAKETDPVKVLSNAPVYTRATPGFSLEFNMPVDAFSAKDWWTAAGGAGFVAGDTRVGLQPTQTGCVNNTSSTDVLFESVIPPTNGTDGPGTASTSAGARHNGALVVQLIRDTTTSAQIELNVAGRPEYGWRVKAASFASQVLAEYTTFWHHPNGKCYSAAGWTKVPPPDTSPSDPRKYLTPAAGSNDPKLGSFRPTSNVASVTTTTSGNVTTTVTTFVDGTKQTVTSTKNSDGTTTIVTRFPDGTSKTVIVADASGDVVSGGDEKGTQARTGRISWSERLRN